jgi:arylformamidase
MDKRRPRWHDVTRPMRAGMTVWPDDPAFEMEPVNRIATGSSCNTSLLTFSTHTGTHIDAPWHFENTGLRLDQVDSAVFFGEASLIELPSVKVITAADLGSAKLPARILLKTANSNLSLNAPFAEDFVALDAEAAQRLVDDGVRLVGIDYLSIAPFKNGDETHHRLLRNNVLIVEGLNLAGLTAGTYEFVVLPLPIAGADGAPCRAFVGQEDHAV